MKKERIIYLTTIVGLCLAMVFTFRSCTSNRQQYLDATNYIAAANDTIKYLRDSSVAQKQTIEVTADLFEKITIERADLREALEQAKVKAKNVSSMTSVTSGVVLPKPLIIRIDSLIPCPDFQASFKDSSRYHLISGNIDNKTVTINRINFVDTLSIITSTKHHLFKGNESIVSVQHSNQYCLTTGIEQFNIREKKRWYEKRGIGIVTGLLLGYFIFR